MPNPKKTGATQLSRRYHHGNLRAAIEETTLELLRTSDVSSISLREIARKLGVSEAAPYHHFAGKAELLAALATRAWAQATPLITGAIGQAGDAPGARLAALCRSFIHYCIENPAHFRVMFGAHMGEVEANHPEAWRVVYEAGHPARILLQEVVAGTVGEGTTDAADIEFSVWASCYGIAWLATNNEFARDPRFTSMEAIIERSISLLSDGLPGQGR